MQEKYTNDEIEIDLRELFFELLIHWKVILLSTIMVGVIAFVISFFLITPQYESTSALYVLSKSTSITSLADIQMGTNLTNDYIVVVKGRPVLEQVISNLSLEEENYESLSQKVTLNNPSDSRILEITVRDPDAKLAKRIADEIAEVSSAFISEKMDQDPPTIIQRGYADGEPVSPNIAQNIVLGALVGAFLAIAVVVITYLLNDTIMSADDVERKLGMNLLGTLPLEEEEDDGNKSSSRGIRRKKSEKKE
ncbi:MAG: Wzz/FepE/Etk N-terminal domain-containing protein [Clostridiales bacterium]|nr:Wzz/FepE/Etk N-terminal domain-containing protein [Roseburia sp.]MDD7636321.1 Wzz/FepE/Etk N-terminal domain-containing protein [Clostridiales bacterium]MDY4112633.1 Wzz/FepE/Etk N-terminal domain-containing protein [Roseburia sp.]